MIYGINSVELNRKVVKLLVEERIVVSFADDLERELRQFSVGVHVLRNHIGSLLVKRHSKERVTNQSLSVNDITHKEKTENFLRA